MKVYKQLLFIFLFCSFAFLSNRKLKFDNSYIETFEIPPRDISYKLVFQSELNNKIEIKIYNLLNWTWQNNAKSFCKVILNISKKIFQFEDFTIWVDWDKNFQDFSEIKNRHFLYLNLGDSRYVIALKGSMSSSHNQGCPILTLILVSEEEPKVIFNTHVRLLEIRKNDDNTCKLRVRFGRYEYNEQSVTNAKGRLVPCNFDDVYVCDLYVRNNELVVEKLPYTRQGVYETFTEEEIEASYN